MTKKEKTICLRIDSSTFQMIKFLADKYDRSINSEINLLLRACVSKWNVKNVKIHELPREILEVQNDNWEERYDSLIEDIRNRKTKVN